MKEGNMSPYQEAPVPEGAARMMTKREILNSFDLMGPEEASVMLQKIEELSKRGLKDEASVGDLKDALQDRSKDGK